MRVAIISDIHSNLEALSVVIDFLEDQKPDKIYCLGDIVGYGPNPIECIKLIRQYEIETICGNHDHAVLKYPCLDHFNKIAKTSALWTHKILKREYREFLKSLPYIIEQDDFVLTHSSLCDPEQWCYLFSAEDAIPSFKILTKKICFSGHTHIASIFYPNGAVNRIKEGHLFIKDTKHCIINVGSVGQPRDKDNRACFVIYDTEKQKVDFHRLKYNILMTQTKIRNLGLPEYLADRLESGE